tara:strand:+ start:65 stop:1000 length:936 start_codon:yes stop_codon:yes gene_type:complete
MIDKDISKGDKNLFNFVSFVWKNKKNLIFRLLIISLLTVIVVLFIPNTYRSHATLSSKSDDGIGSSSIASALGSISSFAGINVSSQSSASTKDIALESIKSYTFFKELYKNDKFLVNLLAVKGFENDQSLIDLRKYDVNNNKWVGLKPHPQEAYDVFLKKVIINEDAFKPIITISILSRSPYAAKEMNDLILSEIDKFIKVKDVDESKKAIKYLEEEISKTRAPDVKDALSNMITQYMSKILTSEKSDSYVFNIIDQPYAPIEKYKPKRAIICIQVFIIFLFLELLLLYFSFAINKAISFKFKKGIFFKDL